MSQQRCGRWLMCALVLAVFLAAATGHATRLRHRARVSEDPAAGQPGQVVTTAQPANGQPKEAVKEILKEEKQAKKLDDPAATKTEEQNAAKRLDDPIIGPGALASELPSTGAAGVDGVAGPAVHKPKITIVSNVNVLNTQRRARRSRGEYQKELKDIEATSQAGQLEWEKSHAEQIAAVKDSEAKQNEDVRRMEEREQIQEKKELQQLLTDQAADDKKKKQEQQAELDKKNDQNVRQTEELKLVDTLKPWTPDMGGDYDPPRVDRWSELCVVSGLVKGTNNGVVGYLPEWCRPQSRVIFTVFTSNPANGGAAALSRVDVLPDGRIYHVCCGERTGWMSLSGIWFDVADRESKPALADGWTVYGGGWRAPQINKFTGVCALSGLVRGQWANVVAQLNMGDCNPQGGNVIFSGNNHEGVARLDVGTDGSVKYWGGGRNFDWVSLDGMLWSNAAGDKLQLLNAWDNFQQDFRVAQVQKLGRLCVVSGLIKSDAWNQHIATLPESCRPKKRLVFGTNVHDRNARVDVTPEGQLLFVYGKGQYNWLSLDGIKFISFDPQ